MVAINSAIEVDVTGQVCADSIGAKMYSGVVDKWFGDSGKRTFCVTINNQKWRKQNCSF
jgi:hypothetical protein